MPLSRLSTARDVYRSAIRQLPVNQNSPVYVERFSLINQATDAIIGLFYDLMSQSYMTVDTILAGGTTGNYSVVLATATWDATTRILAAATMNVDFYGPTHTGWLLQLLDSSGHVYPGTIAQVLSTTSIVISGDNLPTSNLTAGQISYVLCSATPPTGNTASLTGLQIMRTGQQIKVEIESTATKQLRTGTSQEVFVFKTGSDQNATTIIWALSGDQILLNKGAGLATYGTLTIRYPRSPLHVTLDTSPMDVPDGVAMELIILKLKVLIAERLGVEIPDFTQMFLTLIQQLYQTFGHEAGAEVLQDKLKALK